MPGLTPPLILLADRAVPPAGLLHPEKFLPVPEIAAPLILPVGPLTMLVALLWQAVFPMLLAPVAPLTQLPGLSIERLYPLQPPQRHNLYQLHQKAAGFVFVNPVRIDLDQIWQALFVNSHHLIHPWQRRFLKSLSRLRSVKMPDLERLESPEKPALVQPRPMPRLMQPGHLQLADLGRRTWLMGQSHLHPAQ